MDLGCTGEEIGREVADDVVDASSTSSATVGSRWCVGGETPTDAGSRSVEAGGGDALGTELEAPLERGDGTTA